MKKSGPKEKRLLRRIKAYQETMKNGAANQKQNHTKCPGSRKR